MQLAACVISYGYIAWTPSGEGDNASLLFDFETVNGNYTLRTGTLGKMDYDNPGYGLPGAAFTFFIAALPGMVSVRPTQGCLVNGSERAGLLSDWAVDQISNATVAQCFMYNASYTANFSYVDGTQSISARTSSSYNYVAGGDLVGNPSMLTATFANGTYDLGTYNSTIVERYAYEAIMDSFVQMLVGSISNLAAGDGVNLILDTEIITTGLVNTKELGFFSTYYFTGGGANYSLQALPSIKWNGLSVFQTSNWTLSLVDAVEQVFQNVTISLMSSEVV